ncbi:hypothetical protein [Enterococcus faecalis]|uniref:ESAT-6 secretion machinery protein EssA n=1 Tax=Enterococcus faecalis RP2S-4 TaxID=1244145 RepID=A0ABC9TI01_ENTFL|nr:hypothetical protein [Enterococcus faecalis]EPI04813.1 hypothetical protein D358_02779 [Enterococcus faecalis RP2S-4]
MRKIGKIIFVLSVSFIYLLFPIKMTEAETAGALKVNNQVIYQDNTQDKSSETIFVIPDLFLPEKIKLEKATTSKKEQIVTAAKKDVFMNEEDTKENDIEQKINPYLFKNMQTVAAPEIVKSANTQQELSTKFWSCGGIFLGGVVFLLFGIFLGRRFSYHRIQTGK